MSEEKTEQASPHKLQEARKKGQVAKSNDVVTAFSFLVVFLLLSFIGKNLIVSMAAAVQKGVRMVGQLEVTPDNFQSIIVSVATSFLGLLAPVFLAVLIAALAGNLLQTGFMFSLEGVTPKAERLNPIESAKKMFSAKGFVESLKVMLRTLLIVVVFQNFFKKNLPLILQSGRMYVHDVYKTMGKISLDLFYNMTLLLIVLAALDYVLQRYLFMKDMMMTKQEVKEEYKMQEGDPMLKQRLRARQRELIKARMLGGVQKARFVVTNPTHYACALKYDEQEDEAPILVAKGKDLIAEQIKKLAREHNVPIHENKPLAQALFKDVEVDEMIPPELYQAVAETIAFLERLNAQQNGQQVQRPLQQGNPGDPGNPPVDQRDRNPFFDD